MLVYVGTGIYRRLKYYVFYVVIFELCHAAMPGRLPFIPMGRGGIQRMTGFLSGNTASRGPVQ